jgi:hypothetical protein
MSSRLDGKASLTRGKTREVRRALHTSTSSRPAFERRVNDNLNLDEDPDEAAFEK